MSEEKFDQKDATSHDDDDEGVVSLTESQCNASAEILDDFCNVCMKLNKDVEAKGFCEQCRVYLCSTCIVQHTVVPATEYHIILDENNLPRDTDLKPALRPQLVKQQRLNTLYSNNQWPGCRHPCPNHPDMLIEFYCRDHEAMTCKIDFTDKHKNCNMEYIPKIAEGIAGWEEMANMFTDIKEIKCSIEAVESDAEEAMESIRLHSEEYEDTVNRLGDELQEHIKSLVQQAIKEKDETVKRMLHRKNESIEVSKHVKEELNALEKHIDDENPSESQMFFFLQSSKKTVTALKAKLTSASICAKAENISFKQNMKTERIKEIESLGELNKTLGVQGNYEDIIIELPDDEEESCITSLQILPGGRILLVDNANYKVKLLDLTDKQIHQSVTMPSEPYDITQVDTGELVITLPVTKQLQFLASGKNLCKNHVVNIDFSPLGIDAYQDKLMVCCPIKVRIIGKDGKHIQNLLYGIQENNLYLGLSRNRITSVMYVADGKAREVICIGLLKAHYRLDTEPRNTTILDDGTVLVSADDGIHHITAAGKKIQMLIDKQELGQTFPAVSYASDPRCLYLAGRILRVYHLQ